MTMQAASATAWDIEPEDDLEPAADEPKVLAESASRGLVPMPADGGPLSMMVSASRDLVREPRQLLAHAKQVGSLLGKTGYYRFPMAGKPVQGVSIGLAQALAQVYGGISFQVRIVKSEPLHTGGKRLHLRATVVDMKQLVAGEIDAVVATIAPPGKFAQDFEQSERWHAMQSQSAASKVVRNAILDVLPKWFVDAGFNAAMDADDRRITGGKSLPEARADAIAALGTLGVTQPEVEAHVEQPIDLWAAPQLSVLRDLYSAIKKGRMSIEQFRASLEASKVPPPAATTGKSALGLGEPKPRAVRTATKEREPEPAERKSETDEERVRREEQEAFEKTKGRS